MSGSSCSKPARTLDLARVAALLSAAIAWRTYRAEVALFFPPRRPPALELDHANLPAARAVALQTGTGALAAWHVPTQNGAAVVLCHGAGGDRSQLLLEAKLLANDGFGVLMFDWPGHGYSNGNVTWNENERRSLVAAVDWLTKVPGVDQDRIGVVGFSLGGYIAAQVAATESRIRALVLLGTPANLNDQVRLSHQKLGWLRQRAARLALERHGIDLDEPQPEHVIGQFSPRPLLIVGGTDDVTVPLELTKNLFERARPPKYEFIIAGGQHGDYATTAMEYPERLRAFLRNSLLLGA